VPPTDDAESIVQTRQNSDATALAFPDSATDRTMEVAARTGPRVAKKRLIGPKLHKRGQRAIQRRLEGEDREFDGRSYRESGYPNRLFARDEGTKLWFARTANTGSDRGMNILGISAFGFNPGACLLRDGDLLAFVEEERFTRVKTAHGAFPLHSIRYCLRFGGIDLDGVDAIAMGWDANKYHEFMPRFFEAGWKKYGDKGAGTRAWEKNCLAVYDPERVQASIRSQLQSTNLGGRVPDVCFIDHHLSHAASAFFPSGMDAAAILTVDGSGEDRTTCIYRGAGADIVELEYYQIPDSLGWFYSTMTQFCGFRHNMDEGKLMGLAPYGKRDPRVVALLDRIVRTDGDRYAIDPFFTYYGEHAPGKGFARRLVDELGAPREPAGGALTDFHRDVAWAAQDKLERVGLMLAQQAMDLAGSRQLCLAGGVALNCKMNGVINQRAGVEELFVQPISSDAGTALGAALWLHRQKTGNRPPFVQRHLYYGPGYSDDEIERLLRGCKLPHSRSADIGKDMADRLAAGKLCAWFQGRMEAGPRALGHRSILAHPGFRK
jgi:carbamoyltransferase